MLRGYALFDFDGTLCAGDSIVRFLRFSRLKGLCSRGDIARALWYAALYALRLSSAEKTKREALRFIAGRDVGDMSRLCVEFCEAELIPRLRPEGLKELRARKTEGCETLMLTASPDFYLEPLKARLGFDGMLATRMDAVESRYTGQICGENCRGVQKPLRLAEYLAAKGDRLDYEASYAYGDSAGDEPMLRLCAHKIAVNPKRELVRRLADAEGVERVCWTDPDITPKEAKR